MLDALIFCILRKSRLKRHSRLLSHLKNLSLLSVGNGVSRVFCFVVLTVKHVVLHSIFSFCFRFFFFFFFNQLTYKELNNLLLLVSQSVVNVLDGFVTVVIFFCSLLICMLYIIFLGIRRLFILLLFDDLTNNNGDRFLLFFCKRIKYVLYSFGISFIIFRLWRLLLCIFVHFVILFVFSMTNIRFSKSTKNSFIFCFFTMLKNPIYFCRWIGTTNNQRKLSYSSMDNII